MKLRDRLRAKRWSPWVCGSVLGVISVAYLVLMGRTLGTSGGFETMDSILVAVLGIPQAASLYFSFVKPPEVTPQMIQYLGMIAGAFLAAWLSEDFRVRTMPDDLWEDRFGPSRAKRWLLMFAGCALLAIGAGIAGGCTSSMGVSGMMQLAPAGLAFIVGCFATGILVTVLLARKGGNRK